MSEEPEGKVVEIGPRFRLIAFDKIVLGSEPAYLVKRLIPRAGLTVIWGPPKCGKSFWTFDLVMHVALGWEYRGRRAQQGGVVYLALEGGKAFEGRVEAFRQRFLLADHDPVPFYLIVDALNLVKEHPDLIGCIRVQAKGNLPAVVVIDTLNRSLAGSESDDRDMSLYVRAADAIRHAFGCAVIIVHHCGIDATRPRGHTSLAGAVDAQLAVKRDAADNIVVTVERMKDGPEGDSLLSRLEPLDVGIDSDGDPKSSCIVLPAEGEAAQAAAHVKKSGRKPTKRQCAIQDAITEALDTQGRVITPRAGMPAVRAAKVSDIRQEFDRRYIVAEPDPAKAANAKRMAFKRALDHLPAQFGAGSALGADWIWRITEGVHQ
jgi:AAA domain